MQQMKKSYGTVVWHLGYRVHLAWIRVMTAEGVRTVPMTRSGQAAGGTHSACAYTLMLSVSQGAAASGAPNVRQCCPNSLCRHCAAGGLVGADEEDRIMHRGGVVAVAAWVIVHGRPFP
jgi:hypothetical protein